MFKSKKFRTAGIIVVTVFLVFSQTSLFSHPMDKNKEGQLYEQTAYFYDLDPRQIFKVDIPFYIEFAQKHKPKRILELAAGSGRVTIPLAKAGHEVWALDLSKIMLDLLKEKKGKLPEVEQGRIKIINADMSNFKIIRSKNQNLDSDQPGFATSFKNSKFDLIIIPIRSFHVLTSEDDAVQCLKNVHNHLEDNGLFIITFLKLLGIDEFESASQNPEEQLCWEAADPKTGLTIKRFNKIKSIDKERVITIDQIYYKKKLGQTKERISEKIRVKHYTFEQMAKLLVKKYFMIVDIKENYGKPLKDDTEIIFICKKK